MKAKQVTYKRVFNVGNYESAALEVVLELEEGDNVDDAIVQAKDIVRAHAPKKSGKVSEKPAET
jgi:hypothetical protein